MAYGFNEDRSKVDVYTADQIDAMDLANDGDLQNEIANRIAAVTGEKNARELADSNEAAARALADSNEAAARTGADTTINARIDQLVTAGTGGIEVRELLWQQAGGVNSGTINLPADFDAANYDCLECECGIAYPSWKIVSYQRIPVTGGTLHSAESDGSNDAMFTALTLSVSGTVVTCGNAGNASSGDGGSTWGVASASVMVSKIYGIKYAQDCSTEVADIRVGYDGADHLLAGNHVREFERQVNDRFRKNLLIPIPKLEIGNSGWQNNGTIYYGSDNYKARIAQKLFISVKAGDRFHRDSWTYNNERIEVYLAIWDGTTSRNYGWRVGDVVIEQDGLLIFNIRFSHIENGSWVYPALTESDLDVFLDGCIVPFDCDCCVKKDLIDLNKSANVLSPASTLFIDSFNENNTSNSTYNSAPFIVNLPIQKPVFITKMKLNVVSIGPLVIGKCKSAGIEDHSSWFYPNITNRVEFNFSATGIQEIEFPYPFFVNPDESIAIVLEQHSCVFKYGAASNYKGFYYKNNNIFSKSLIGIGFNFYILDIPQQRYIGKKLSILGDSISTFNGYIPSGNATYYPSGDVTDVSDTWWKKLIDNTGLVLDTNNSWSGSRVTTTGGESSAGCMTRCQNLGNPDIIIVWMGINDFNNEVALGTYDGTTSVPNVTTTFREAYGIMLNKILTAYPSAEVYVCTLTPCERNSPEGFPEINDNGIALKRFNDAIIELADAFNVRILDHAKSGLTYQNMSVYDPDKLHPNKLGHTLIANYDKRHLD